jgi:demethylmenaquinone methyltransferase/2-methoxy-6-polyprenyl-1,4-benzoquinol methylase
MTNKTLSTPDAQRFYDRIGSRYDWFEFYEAKAKERARNALHLAPGLTLLNVGVGTGKELAHLLDAITPGGTGFGLDISPIMLGLTYQRTSAPVCLADARSLPYAEETFDRLYAGYVLDLLPYPDLLGVIVGFHRVLKQSGRMAILALTEGVDRPSKALISAWKMIFAINPAMCGGCRPLQLFDLVNQAGFKNIERQVIVQFGVPSELIAATKT